jgi:hypothetical protein
MDSTWNAFRRGFDPLFEAAEQNPDCEPIDFNRSQECGKCFEIGS